MTTLDVFHLPGLLEDDVAAWNTRALDSALHIRWPRLDPAGLERQIARVRANRAAALSDRPANTIVEALAAAAERLADPAGPLRSQAEAALPALTGYAPAMVGLVLDRMAADWTAPALHALLRAELFDPLVLDTFRPHPEHSGTVVRAFGPELAFHIFAGNVPGVAVTAMLRALLVKSAVLAKTASGEPLLAALFARALAEVDAALAGALAVTYWEGGSETLETVALEAADAVVVYGGEEVEAEVRRRAGPGTRLIVHGPRYSLGLIAREILAASGAATIAAAVARAASIFDQQGCVSPHLVYVERGGEIAPAKFAGLVADAFATLEKSLPRGTPPPAETARIHQERAAAEFRAHAGGTVELHAGPGTSFTVVYDEEPGFDPSCLNRFLRVRAIDALEEAPARVRPFARYLQTVGIAADPARAQALATAFGRLGASRVAPFGAMPWPPPAWHHDGRGPLRELLRWTDLEE